MVFFTCNSCGTAVKKNQVDKHIEQCRHYEAVSCMDCGKDFWGKTYQSHTKCISEEEKYSGKNYQQNPNANKREKLMEQWSHHVQNYMSTNPVNGKLKRLLEMLLKQENVPKKEKKFKNFLSQSFSGNDEMLIESAWTIFHDAIKASQPVRVTKASTEEKSVPSKESAADSPSKVKRERSEVANEQNNGEVPSAEIDENGKSRSKKKHKKNKRKNETGLDETTAAETQVEECPAHGEEPGAGKKKGKKRKSEAVENNETPTAEEKKRQDQDGEGGVAPQAEDFTGKKKSKKHKKNVEKLLKNADEECPPAKSLPCDNGTDNGDRSVEKSKKRKHSEMEVPVTDSSAADVNETSGKNNSDGDGKKNKFKWTKIMEETVSQSPEQKMKLKKLKKKVLGHYRSFSNVDDLSEASKRFDEKLSGCSNLRIDGKSVSCASSE